MKMVFFLGTLGLVLSAVLFCGCETESASAPVHVTPATTTIQFGQAIEFSASGGYDYRWSLSDHTLGTLSVNTGPSTLYTSIYDGGGGGTNQLQTITVQSTIDGSRTGGTNATSYAASADAVVTHF